MFHAKTSMCSCFTSAKFAMNCQPTRSAGQFKGSDLFNNNLFFQHVKYCNTSCTQSDISTAIFRVVAMNSLLATPSPPHHLQNPRLSPSRSSLLPPPCTSARANGQAQCHNSTPLHLENAKQTMRTSRMINKQARHVISPASSPPTAHHTNGPEQNH